MDVKVPRSVMPAGCLAPPLKRRVTKGRERQSNGTQGTLSGGVGCCSGEGSRLPLWGRRWRGAAFGILLELVD